MHDFLFVHGAFSNAAVWQTLVPHVANADTRVTAIDLPGHTAADTARAGAVTMDDYVARVIEALDAAPEPVIVVGHSMGGIPISGAAQARPAKVAALVYLCAILPESEKTLQDYSATDTQSKLGTGLQADPAIGTARITEAGARMALLNRSEEAAVKIALGFTFPQPLQPFGKGVTLTPDAFGTVRRFYIATTDDNAIGHDLQMRMLAAQPCERVFSIDTDHMPMLSATGDVARALGEIRTIVG